MTLALTGAKELLGEGWMSDVCFLGKEMVGSS